MYEFQPVRVAETLLVCFGALAVLLSAFGLYGVLAFRVAQRTREIAVRMALGAGAGAVAGLVLRRGALLALAGVAIGVVAALASVRLLGSVLYGVSGGDPLAFASACLLMIGVALTASYLPARRATRRSSLGPATRLASSPGPPVSRQAARRAALICPRWCSLWDATLSNSSFSVRTPVTLCTNSSFPLRS